ncbi:MAG: helix-turn-helix transcriptional regulator [Thermodesulfovibrionales bacterium]
MNIVKRREKLISKLKDKEYRDAFVSALITSGIPFQIKALREQRTCTQKELGKLADMAQESISRLEDPNYGKLNLNTLKRLAAAFDIGLMVRFVPFSELVEWDINLSNKSLEVTSFNEEVYFKEQLAGINSSSSEYLLKTYPDNVVPFISRTSKTETAGDTININKHITETPQMSITKEAIYG